MDRNPISIAGRPLKQWIAIAFAIVVVLIAAYGALWEFMDATYRRP